MLDIETFLIVMLAVMALWRRHVMLYVASFASLVIYGFSYAQTELATGIALIIVACYMLYQGVLCLAR